MASAVRVRAAGPREDRQHGSWRAVGLALLVIACGPDPIVDGLNLEGTRWRAIEVAGLPPVAGHEPTFDHQGVLADGWAGCNDYSWTYTSLFDDAISVRGLSVSQRQCEGGDAALASVEERYFAALRAAERINIIGRRLAISTRLGTLLFEPLGGAADRSGRIRMSARRPDGRASPGQPGEREESPSSTAQGSG